jgi:hypothetical protein
MEAPKQTFIYSYKLKLQGGGVASGRVEAEDHRQATEQATRQWSSYTVLSGNITLLKNQDAARKQNFSPLKI